MISKFSSILLLVVFVASGFSLQSQTAEEIVSTYLETIGGEEALSGLKTMTIKADSKFQGMDIPIMMYQAAPNMQRMDMIFQGQEITQMCFDGEVGWSTNFMTQQAELWEQEDSDNMKHQMEFPDAFLNYEKKGYSIALDGEETIDGTECFKLKLTKSPLSIDGKEVENYTHYYFDKETMVPIMQEEYMHKGPMAGGSTQMYFSDYQEVDGIYFPYALSQKMNGQPMFDMVISEISVNPEIDEGLFATPDDVVKPTKPAESMDTDEKVIEPVSQPAEGKSGGDPGKGGQ